jgi:uncharacterized protein YbaP (TraB family)
MPDTRQVYITLPVRSVEDLKIRLKHDRISRNTFMNVVIDAYLSGDKNMQEVIMRYKEDENIGRSGARKIERKIYKDRDQNIKDYNLEESLGEDDLNELFDILEKEWDNL